MQGEHEFPARVAAHRSAFAPSKMTLERYRKLHTLPGYRPEHDLIAVAPDNTIAAFAIIWNDGITGVGVFEPVGTHAEHQQRGLARAILTEGLHRLTAEGCHTAVVLSAGGRDPSYRLYQSAGFRVLDRIVGYRLSAISG
jgi:ribosomal protein S18 acetylase RimI-like enzyme